MERTAAPVANASLIERRSIDYIPEAERHGNLFSQFTLWFGANLQVTAVVVGALAVVLGGDVFWSLVGLLVGQVFGGAVMALHGAQGPQLGLPQMISSRVQFGVYGAIVPLALVCVMYVGFSAGGTVLAGQAVAELLHVSHTAAILTFSVLVILLTGLGYRTIHAMGRVSSIVGTLAFLYLFASLLNGHAFSMLLANRHFTFASFLLAVSLSASWQIAYGPYVADYSRYLPRNTSPAKTFLAVFSGTVIGAQVSMTFGVLAAALAGARFSGHEVTFIVGLGATGAIAAVLYFTIALGKLTITTLNAYGSVMSVAAILTGFGGRREISPRTRFAFVLLTVAASSGIALAGQHDFLKAFSSFLLFLLVFFTPWSAINLVDYYWITRERYDVAALFEPDGRYGRWNARGLAVYAFGVLVQMPFVATGFYTGPWVDAMGGVDVSWIVGIVVPGVLYYVVSRRSRPAVPDRLIMPDSAHGAD
ncbi:MULTISPECIES: purine-cytosine permease family protein [Burkholderia cepacia complex]|uniref:Sulfonate ABC transporter substrate-binding protein n=1 Tax=Burkholderia stabilis TaxID=95485 RepID=A0A1Y1BSH4_9BURK|nr:MULTISPECIES: cytosine permease [Burkholderia cepacia complex]UVE68813.1 cytosine permease [Burkholderia pyrrocinia]BAX61219.1 sulfonate ABC transporter substrate-binding protein [Burkholderia stabilis]